MPVDIGVHDLTSSTSHSPYVVRSTNDYSANPRWKAFDSAAGNDFHINQGGGVGKLQLDLGNAGGTEITVHDLTTNSSHSPIVVSASSVQAGGFEAFRAFDNDTTRYWIGNGSGVDWLKIDFGSGNTYIAKSYWIRVNAVPEPNRAPKNWTFEGSNDNSSWTTIHTVTNQQNWDNNETRYFEPTDISTAYRYFRINISANNGDATFTQIEEFYIYTTVLDSSRSQYLGSYTIQVATTAARAPKTWTIEGKNHLGGGWDTLDTRTSETAWGSNEARTYNCATVLAQYESFRINFTANNGDGTYTEIKEFTLFQGSTPSGSTDITLSDSLALSDSIETNVGIQEEVSDSLSLTDSIDFNLATVIELLLSDDFSLTDSISLVLADLIAIDFTLSDIMALSDSIVTGLNYQLIFSDLMSLTDSIVISNIGGLVFNDLMSMSDSIVIRGQIDKEFFDRLILSDLVKIDASAAAILGDTLVLTDSTRIVLELNIEVGDSLSLSDSIATQLITALNLVISDLMSMSDSIGMLASTSDTNYLRDYLNDVQGVRTPETIADPDVESPDALNSYLRRYLNDVS